jgi:HlyD family secretion protein
MVIVPEISEIIAQLEAPMAQSGKIEIGQTVNIKLDNYPVAEYGAVEGRIESISMIPVRNVYSIKVSLPKGLTTSYKRELTFRQEIQGTAEIITNDMRLIERILNQVRNLIDNAS